MSQTQEEKLAKFRRVINEASEQITFKLQLFKQSLEDLSSNDDVTPQLKSLCVTLVEINEVKIDQNNYFENRKN